MGYSKYKTVKQVVDKFNISVKTSHLIKDVKPLKPSSWLIETLEIAELGTLSNEKVKSERIISPILSEMYRIYKDKLTLFSGEELTIEPENDLNGPCDFFFSGKPNAYLLEAPIVSLTEANPDSYRGEDLDYGIAQCTAQMIGALKYNQTKDEPIDVIWGCATTADVWKFIKLENNTLYVDTKNYYLDRIDILLGVFKQILDDI